MSQLSLWALWLLCMFLSIAALYDYLPIGYAGLGLILSLYGLHEELKQLKAKE